MTIKEIIDAERWDRNVFDPEGRHNTASIHNASLDRIEAGVSCVSEYVAELEAELEEYKGHFVDGLKECWYRGESIKSLQEHLDTANKRIAELEAQLPKVIEPKNGTCMCGNLVRGFDPVHYGWKYNYCPNCGAKLNWEDA